MTEIDVVVITWNDPPELLRDAVNSALDSADVSVSVTVVDNGSDPPAQPPVDSRVRLIRNDRNLGVAGGRNVGIKAGRAPLVCLLDSDARLSGGSLRLMADRLVEPAVGMVVPVFDGQTPQESAGLAPTLGLKLRRAVGQRSDYDTGPATGRGSVWPVEFGIGACQLFRRDVFDFVGGLDEGIFYGPEDVDFCLRVRHAGFQILQVDGADVHHPPRRAFRNPFSRRGAQHAAMVVRHLWRHRRRRPSTGAPRISLGPADGNSAGKSRARR